MGEAPQVAAAGAPPGAGPEVSSAVEPLLADNPDRFCMFPIKYPQIWDFYKKAEASFWTGAPPASVLPRAPFPPSRHATGKGGGGVPPPQNWACAPPNHTLPPPTTPPSCARNDPEARKY